MDTFLAAVAAFAGAVLLLSLAGCVVEMLSERRKGARRRDWLAAPFGLARNPRRVVSRRLLDTAVSVVFVGPGSRWENPWAAGDQIVSSTGETLTLSSTDAVRLYASWCIETGVLARAYEWLDGVDLACSCSLSEPCHADWLLAQFRSPEWIRRLTKVSNGDTVTP